MNDINRSFQTPPPLPGPSAWMSNTLVRMGILLLLVLVFLIPQNLIQGVLAERLQRRNEAVAGITTTWGAAQSICGPVLIVPYHYRVTTPRSQLVNGQATLVPVTETQTAYAHFLPEDLKISGDLKPSVLHRGIYQAVVYGGAIQLEGRFAKPVFDDWKVEAADVIWDEAVVTVAVSDLRGARETIVLKWGDESLPMAPCSKLPEFTSGVHVKVGKSGWDRGAPASFALQLTFNGSTGIRFIPVGQQTQVTLTSPWADPSFTGAFLPAERKVGAAGFEATWKVSSYGRDYPQQWSSRDGFNANAIRSSAFGADLIEVVDTYRYVERAIKYGLLFVVLVFTAFFLYEILAPLRVHPLQYTLVAMALCLFYLALISLSEIVGFGLAYLISAAAATLMVMCYSIAVLKRFSRVLLIGVELGAIYGFLFVILRLQDYSLLFGTAGLFVALGLVMYLTRKIDWYSRESREGREGARS